jgi:hypothetical protein
LPEVMACLPRALDSGPQRVLASDHECGRYAVLHARGSRLRPCPWGVSRRAHVPSTSRGRPDQNDLC